MFVNFGDEEVKYCLPVIDKLRKASINAELYPDAARMKKQLGWANNKGIPFIVMAGTEEIKNKKFMLKNMNKGEQEQLTEEELIKKLK